MTLHLLGIPHTISSPEYSHCAFTGKVLRFGPMMGRLGYKVIHYGNGPGPEGVEHVSILNEGELFHLVGKRDKNQFYGDLCVKESPVYKLFNNKLMVALQERVRPRDIICFPFGSAHADAVHTDECARAFWVESGVGYEDSFCPFKIFESYAWLHWHHGKYQYRGSDYEWVIPNYFDESEWEPNYRPGEFLLFFGRICEIKGLDIVVEIAKARPDLKVVICGQGDPKPYLTVPNIEYHPPVNGMDRSDLVRKAIAVLCPSRYIEPFGGVAVEAMLCGRPVLASHFGAFTETLPVDLRLKLHTLGDWLDAVEMAEAYEPDDYAKLESYAFDRFTLGPVGRLYDRAFRQISMLAEGGWYAKSLRTKEPSATKTI